MSDLTEIIRKRAKSLRFTVVSLKVAVQINAPVHGCRRSVNLELSAFSSWSGPVDEKSDQIEIYSAF